MTAAPATSSKPSRVSPSPLGDADLEGFRKAQQVAYACAEAVANNLEPGMTERQAASAMRKWLSDAGVNDWFHVPFAWFGDRTAFRGVRLPHQFFPTKRALEPGMPYILDCAPVVEGYVADIGYTGSLGPNSEVDGLCDTLAGFRTLVLEQVRAGRTQGEVYRAVEGRAAEQGLETRHRAYPFGVLAHQVGRQPGAGNGSATKPGRSAFGFGTKALRTLARSYMVAAPGRRSPLWNRGPLSIHPATPGLWAVEPHLGRGPVGAKFEELLVITDSGAYWLDDDLPHVRRWQERGVR